MKELINRSLLIIKPRKPYLDWAKSIDNESRDITIEELSEDCSVYLVRDYGMYEEQEIILQKHYRDIFREQLNSWMLDESTWPVKRDYKTFKRWFRVEFHSLIYDLESSKYITEDN